MKKILLILALITIAIVLGCTQSSLIGYSIKFAEEEKSYGENLSYCKSLNSPENDHCLNALLVYAKGNYDLDLNESYCENISKEEYKDVCYTVLEKCDLIKNSQVKALCESEVEKKPKLDKISNEIIEIEYPSKWTIDEFNEEKDSYVLGISKESNTCLFTFILETKESFIEYSKNFATYDLKTFNLEQIRQKKLKSLESSQSIIKKDSILEISGNQAHTLEYETPPIEELSELTLGYYGKTTSIIIDNDVIVFGYSGILEDCKEIETELNTINKSIIIKK